VKDGWKARAVAAFLATLPAFLLLYWSSTVKRRLVNQNHRDSVTNRLAQFLSANPQLANDANVVFVRQMILDSSAEDSAGDFDVSAQSLASADGRLLLLTTAVPSAAVPLAAGGEAIRVATAPDRLLSGEQVKFIIGQPNSNWPAVGGLYDWAVTSAQGDVIAERRGIGLTRFACVCPAEGRFHVSVSVDHANTETRDVTILQRPGPGIIESFKLVQLAMIAATLLLGFGTAYVMTESQATFGTVGDYVRLAASAFGISGGTGSVATILSSIRQR
jgi:hypothetical protein